MSRLAQEKKTPLNPLYGAVTSVLRSADRVTDTGKHRQRRAGKARSMKKDMAAASLVNHFIKWFYSQLPLH